ncbi:MAG: M81 family metallopeptidase [Ectothiorhodospiraceae bacterium]|nr:M81 family metallopeptidase [Chromatiales bacterium]MCP5156391.1 M81 family metallopeptidase [Ectothiorhodospiraceae bacterium]
MARIAVGGFQHETNTFAPSKADLAAFQVGGAWPPLTTGPALFEAVRGINISVSGFIDEAERLGHTLLPTTWCAASPSAHVTEHAFEHVARLILDGIRAALPVDAVYLCLHGAMVTEHLEDGEGELLARVRALVGPTIPVVASLDYHSNTTPRMVESATGMIGYRTYPHIDMAETGRRAAIHLHDLLHGSDAVHHALRQLPFLVPLNWQCTTTEPTRSLMEALRELEREHEVKLTYTAGFPAADIHHCGPAVFGYGPVPARVRRAVESLAAEVAVREGDFAGRLWAPEEGVREAMRIAAHAGRPVVLADTQDNPGAGGDSDTTGMLRALVELDAPGAALGLMVDHEAALAAHAAGLGAELTLGLGGRSFAGDRPFEATFRVEALGDGRVRGTGPMYSGARMELGPMACLRVRDVRVAVASHKAQLADQSMYRHVGIEPTAQRILVNKSSVHFRADFEPIAETILVCVAPGPMVADCGALPWTRLRRGMRIRPLGPAFG